MKQVNDISSAIINLQESIGDIPQARVGVSLLSEGKYIYLFGGRLMDGTTNDLYSFNIENQQWTKILYTSDKSLEKRSFHSLNLINKTEFVICAGQCKNEDNDEFVLLNDVCVYNILTHRWKVYIMDSNLFKPRYAHLSGVANKQLIVVGGQNEKNEYIEQISIFSLEGVKLQLTKQIDFSFGSYRSSMALFQNTFYLFSNSKFSDVQRELFTLDEDFELNPSEISTRGQELPPGLRFPESYIIDNYMLISGIYISNKTQTYTLWSMDLDTLEWQQISTGAFFTKGSWNKGIFIPSINKYLVFGDLNRDLLTDYNERRNNFNNSAFIDLESHEIYKKPYLYREHHSVNLGLELHLKSHFCDIVVYSIDGYRIDVNSGFLKMRWPQYEKHVKPEAELHLEEEYDIIQLFVKYLYSDTLDDLDVFTLGRFLIFSHHYSMKEFSDMINNKLHELLNIENSVDIFKYAYYANKPGLKSRCLLMMVNERNELLKNPKILIDYPIHLRDEIISYMPLEFQKKIHQNLNITKTPNDSRKSSVSSITNASSTNDKGKSSPFSTMPAKKSGFMKLGSSGRRPSLAQFFGFGGSNTNSDDTSPASSTKMSKKSQSETAKKSRFTSSMDD